jgi:hypothetical protein
MKTKFSVVMLLGLLCVAFAGCKPKEPKPVNVAPPSTNSGPHSMPVP